jgi:LysR family transcriptional activator of nhaA
MNYHHLRYFRAIAHEGSLTRAAENLHLSQSALSAQLKKLEEQLGHALFERVGKRLQLTEAGRIALDYADTVFQAGEELQSTLRDKPRADRQVLRVGALTTLSRNFQLEFLRPLVGRADVELVVRSGTMRELLEQLETHALDAVLANKSAHRDAKTVWHNDLIAEQPVSLVGRASRSARRFRFPEDLRQVPLLLPSLDSEMRIAFDRILSDAGIRPIIEAEVDDMAMLRLLARESKGVTLVPPVVVRDELRTGTLMEHCSIPDIKERFFAITQTRRFPNPLLKQLLTADSRFRAEAHDRMRPRPKRR